MLITYPDSLGGTIPALTRILDRHFANALGGVHLLPFYPASGDRGFAVTDHTAVDPAFGTWEDIRRLSERYSFMADFMINHISVQSREFLDYLHRGDASPYREMFLHWDSFWPGGAPSPRDLSLLYRRKPAGPWMDLTRQDGTRVRLWNTFFSQQVDLDPRSDVTRAYYRRCLRLLARYCAVIRLDAFAYVTKRPGTSCFFLEPELWEILDDVRQMLGDSPTALLPEVHERWEYAVRLNEHGCWSYDFYLPMLVLHALFTGRTDRLLHWLRICPRRQFTTLDTHDGIGVVDVAGLLTDEEIRLVCDRVDRVTRDILAEVPGPPQSGGGKRYQLNCTYYSALGSDEAYLLARAIQFFTPGIPQVYYVGLLAGENDPDGVRKTRQWRSINRHNYTESEILAALQRPVVRDLRTMMEFRSTYPAFGGELHIAPDSPDGVLRLTWTRGPWSATLCAHPGQRRFSITYLQPDGSRQELPLITRRMSYE